MINEFARRSSIWTRIGTGLQWRILSGLLVLGYAVVATHLSAQPASIVKDLNTQAQSGDSLDRDNGMVESGGFVLFNALDEIHGEALWRTDGTTSGTQLVKDTDPVGHRGPSFLTDVGGTAFFLAGDPEADSSLWKTDGTTAGTVRIPGDFGEGPHGTTKVTASSNGLFFFIQGASTLWRSDGTESETFELAGPCFFMRGLEDVNGTLFFTHVGCVDGTPQGLWKTDGTVGGTVVVKQGIDAFRKFFTLTNVDGTLYFNAFDGGNGFELWKSEIPYNDANTSIVADLIPGPGSSDPLELTDFGGILFFTRLNATGERELWKSGGTAATTEQVSTTTFSASGGISDLTAVNSALFFRADFGSGLWVSDGTEGGTLKIKDVNAQDLTVSNNTLFFNGTDAGGDSELWTSDGTSGGTDVVTQINTTGSSRPSLLTDLGGILVLAADDGAVGKELWRSNGTAGGTELVRDINLEQGSSKPTLLTDVDGKLFFSADDGTGRELWESNGEELGTIAISAPEHPDLLTNVDGTLYFVTPADELWKSNQSGEALVKSFAGIGQIREMIDFDGTLYLAVDGLWKSDGTGTGTEKVTNSVSFPRSLTESGGKLFFSGTDTGGDEELWKVEGTNTVEVEDIRASGSSRPGDLVDVNGTLFFDADDGQVGRELWKSDGTAAGTQPILDINPAGSAFFGLRQPVGTRPTNVDGELYFVAFDGGATGSELWKSDGLGATLIKDINMSGPSFPGFTNFGGMVDVGGILFFVASDGLSGFELWRSKYSVNPSLRRPHQI